MAGTKLQAVYVALTVLMVASAQLAQGAVTCGLVASDVAPCLSYITGRGPLVPACCGGIRSLNAAAGSTPDRQQACRCLKAIAGSVNGINWGIAGGLPRRCSVNVPFPINPSINCNT